MVSWSCPRITREKVRFCVRRKILSLTLLLIFLLAFPCFAHAFSGKVVGVADGDTITVLRDKEQVS